jgi:hypothetical protein
VNNGEIHISSSPPSGPSHEYFIRQNLENSGMGASDIKQIGEQNLGHQMRMKKTFVIFVSFFFKLFLLEQRRLTC